MRQRSHSQSHLVNQTCHSSLLEYCLKLQCGLANVFSQDSENDSVPLRPGLCKTSVFKTGSSEQEVIVIVGLSRFWRVKHELKRRSCAYASTARASDMNATSTRRAGLSALMHIFRTLRRPLEVCEPPLRHQKKSGRPMSKAEKCRTTSGESEIAPLSIRRASSNRTVTSPQPSSENSCGPSNQNCSAQLCRQPTSSPSVWEQGKGKGVDAASTTTTATRTTLLLY